MVEFGTDINRDWSFNNGDLVLVQDEDNLAQSIINRVNCYQPSFNVYYGLYGGFLMEHLGSRRNDESLKFIKIELDSILEQEERVNEFESTLSYADDGSVKIDLTLTVNDENVDLNLILSRDGVSVAD